MRNLKSDKGITLISLTIYMIGMLVIISILAIVREYFFKNIALIEDTGRYAASFDKFNSYFVKDVKNNKKAAVTSISDSISVIFEDGTTYVYNEADKGIYRQNIKIATNIQSFSVEKQDIIIGTTKKQILKTNILIGATRSNKLYQKTINYTLKYW